MTDGFIFERDIATDEQRAAHYAQLSLEDQALCDSAVDSPSFAAFLRQLMQRDPVESIKLMACAKCNRTTADRRRFRELAHKEEVSPFFMAWATWVRPHLYNAASEAYHRR